MKQCPHCREMVDKAATRCPYCTAEIPLADFTLIKIAFWLMLIGWVASWFR